MTNIIMDTMKNKTVLITGATSGIGQATAQGLASCGAQIVMVARNQEKALATKDKIIEATSNEKIHILMADLSSQASIRNVAKEFQSQFKQLDILINNAGGMWGQRQLTVDNLEMTFAVDHLAYFLLTNLLIDTLTHSAPSRIINVSSGLQRSGKINFDDLQAKKNYSALGAYNQAKLANVMFTYELARRLSGTGVTANCLHPGVVRTGFGKEAGVFFKVFAALFSLMMIPAEKGAVTSVYLATAPELVNITGKYFDNKKEVTSNPISYDEAACKKLWDISAELTNL